MILQIAILVFSLLAVVIQIIYILFRPVIYKGSKTNLLGYVAIVTGGGSGIGK